MTPNPAQAMNESKSSPWPLLALPACLFLAGCGAPTDESGGGGAPPVFSLAWSEYPSWSVFGVAGDTGLIDGREGSQGSVEKKWEVDIVLREASYDACITTYGANQVDAACLTNMDALGPSLSRPSTMILATSTSDGADACIVVGGIGSVQDLKGKKVFGLEKTVSEYCFVRNLELLGEKESDYQFSNMDPANAAIALQQKDPSVEAIVVWNPFVIQTLANRSDAKVLFDSTKIPEEIIDAVIVGQDSLARPGGEAFACAVIEAFYAINQRMADPSTGDATLIAIGEKFAQLDLETMQTIVKQTRFYGTPAEGKAILEEEKMTGIMSKVVRFCTDHEMIGREPVLAYDGGTAADLRFDSSYIDKIDAEAP